MPRHSRTSLGGIVYHVLNRGVGKQVLFKKPGDYYSFEQLLLRAHHRFSTRILCYCVMPTHWHLVLWPNEDGELSQFMRWLTLTHTQRWHLHRNSSGTGPIYQGRYKSFPVQDDYHLLRVCRYVERNALRAGLVNRAEEWQWCSLWKRLQQGTTQKFLISYKQWPISPPDNWLENVNQAETNQELETLSEHIAKGTPLGNQSWTDRISGS